MPLEAEEEDAIDNFVAAWEAFFMESSVAGLSPLEAVLLEPALLAMKDEMEGLSEDGAEALKKGIVKFWDTVILTAPLVWVTVPPVLSATGPLLLDTLPTELEAVFLSNTEGKLDKGPAALAIAGKIYPLQLGGLATMTPPPPETKLPIL